MVTDSRTDWDIILRYLVSVAHTNVIVEWNGKRWFYTQPEHIQRGIFMLPSRAPKNTPVMVLGELPVAKAGAA